MTRFQFVISLLNRCLEKKNILNKTKSVFRYIEMRLFAFMFDNKRPLDKFIHTKEEKKDHLFEKHDNERW